MADRQRVAMIGDLAGHLDELTAELIRLGADDDLTLPGDLTVIQVGDLVHRGPDSAGVVALVDRYLTEQPERWVQLAGNHEAQYLREPVFEWPERIDPAAQEALRAWWSDGAMRPAAAVDTETESFLITHAGLTEGFWRSALDAPAGAAAAAGALNSFAGRHEDVLFAPGQMLGGGPPNFAAGPLWAAAASELVPSWLDTPMPFSQVHGHAMVVDWPRRQMRCQADLAERVVVDEDAAHEEVLLDGGRIIGIDPGHGKRAHHPWRAFVVEGARVIA